MFVCAEWVSAETQRGVLDDTVVCVSLCEREHIKGTEEQTAKLISETRQTGRPNTGTTTAILTNASWRTL